MRRKTAEDYHELAESRGIKWLGPVVPNARTKTTWKCEWEHHWEAVYDKIRQGKGCPHCYGNAPKTIKDYCGVGGERNIEWAGEEIPQNTHTKTLWRCSMGHEWEAQYNNILQGRGCPHCIDMVNGVQVSEPQRGVHKMVGGTLNYPIGRKRIDIALPDKMIAIEYDCWFWHGYKQDEDIERVAFLLAGGWKILCIKSNADIPPKWQLDEAIAKLENGEKMAEIVLDDWGKGKTFADVLVREKVDPWEKGPIPVSWNGGLDYVEYQQAHLW